MPWDDDVAALAEEDALREADAEPDVPGAPRPPVVDSAAEDVSPAGDWSGVGVLPPAKEVTAKPATPAAIIPAMIHTSAIGRHKRRCGRLPPDRGLTGRRLIVRTPGRIGIVSRRHAPGGGLRIACGSQQQAFPAGYLRPGAGCRGLCRRLAAQADRRKRPERRSGLGGLEAVAGAVSGANARMIDQRPHFARYPIQGGVAVYHAVQQRRRGPSAERALASGGEGEDRPQAEDVVDGPTS